MNEPASGNEEAQDERGDKPSTIAQIVAIPPHNENAPKHEDRQAKPTLSVLQRFLRFAGNQGAKGWKTFWDIGLDRKIELFLAAAIAFLALAQWNTTKTNNQSTTDQTDKLILAGQVSAMAAEQNAAAAKSFSTSAGRISKSMDAAVVNLGAQATNTENARKSSVEESERSLKASAEASRVAIEATRAAVKAYVLTTNFGTVSLCPDKINQHFPDTYCLSLSFQNFGESPASNLDVFAGVEEGYEKREVAGTFSPCVGRAKTIYFKGDTETCFMKGGDEGSATALKNMMLFKAMMDTQSTGYTARGWIEYDDIYHVRRVTPFCLTSPMVIENVVRRPHACKIQGTWYPAEHDVRQ